MKKEEIQAIEAEGIIKRERGVMWYKKKLAAFAGEIILTKQNLYFVQDGNPLVGVLVKLIVKKAGQHIAWTIPVSAVTDITQEKFGLAKNIASIKHGDSVTNVMVKNVEDWRTALLERNNY